ncbi:MAG TPA: NAD(P)/FAD-dependent oxidoreductase, partial [Chitinophagaceae bacterium]|nr:NAD(P)/FAD-dependent oxidoreductase [Chitinophagaceae bacterium]
PMNGRFLHHADGSTGFHPYGKLGQYINSVSRGELNKKLLDLAEHHGVEIYFNHKCVSVDWTKSVVNFEHPDQDHAVTVHFELLFGADGAYSASRLQHQLQHDKFDYQQYYINCGYKELTIPATTTGDYAMEINALHIWPRKDYMLIALPNQDRSFTCTLFFPIEGETSFSKLDTPEKIEIFFESSFPDAVALMPNFINEFLNNPVSTLVTVKCYPWIRDRFCLIGDAAHAIVPFFGQGMNCGFEDCRVLDEMIDQFDHNWDLILPAFQENRKPDTDAIADLAIGNFAEMREKVTDPKFLLQKKIEAWLHEKHPEKWIPAYSQVTFNPHIHFADALRNAMKQDAIMQEVMLMPHIEKHWNTKEVEQFILQRL